MIDKNRASRIGLALSGGGFRGTLFHLGVVRFLRDAGILSSVSHITSVSGGSVLGAHLVLNWDRYTGTPDQFETAAAEILRFVRLDVRNRIVRRVPLLLPMHLARWMLRIRHNRRLTRTGMLEAFYRNELFGETCLFQLPERPYLHILATNLTEGALCSFTRDGLIVQKRLPGQLYRFDRLHSGLGTLSLAVTASSAFPGFFPPLQLEGREIGATDGQFGRQVFTDGGVFDNLGVRMFRNLERTWIGRDETLSRSDFYDTQCVVQALSANKEAASNSPIGRISEIYRRQHSPNGKDHGPDHEADSVVSALDQIVTQSRLYHDPAFEGVQPEDPEAVALLKTARRSGKELDFHDRVWLNRQLLESVLRQTTGKHCMRPLSSMFDQVLVSDAGKHLRALSEVHDMGMITTAMRASDIGMDRVWQLENETFGTQPGFLFIPITRIVEPAEDSTALNPEIQRQVKEIRTDMDEFSELEISTLVRHGYCVARAACQSRRELFRDELPATPPWDPIDQVPALAGTRTRRLRSLLKIPPSPAPEVVSARLLQKSAVRKVVSRLFSFRDWVSYVYLALLVPIALLIVLPTYHYIRNRQEERRFQQIVNSLVRNSSDREAVVELVRNGPVPRWSSGHGSEPAPITASVPSPTTTHGIVFTSDSRIFDVRNWTHTDQGTKDAEKRLLTYVRRRVRIHKTNEYPGSRPFEFRFELPGNDAEVRCLNSELAPSVRRLASDASQPSSIWQLELNLARIPVGDPINIQIEAYYWQPPSSRTTRDARVDLITGAEIPILDVWILLPEKEPYHGYRLLEFSRSGQALPIHPDDGQETSSGTIIRWTLLNPDPKSRYECDWNRAATAEATASPAK